MAAVGDVVKSTTSLAREDGQHGDAAAPPAAGAIPTHSGDPVAVDSATLFAALMPVPAESGDGLPVVASSMSLASVPDDAMSIVLSFLMVEDIFHVARLCRATRGVKSSVTRVESPRWAVLAQSDLESLCTRFESASTVRLRNCACLRCEETVTRVLYNRPQLRDIALVRMLVTGTALVELAKGPILRSLELSGTILAVRTHIEKLADTQSELEQLQFCDCNTLDDGAIGYWLDRLHSLKYLDLSGCREIGRPPIQLVGPTLKKLVLARCGFEGLPPDDVFSTSDGGTALMTLSVLEELVVEDCPSLLNGEVGRMVSVSPMLRTLSVQTCRALTELRLTNSSLRNLAIGACQLLGTVVLDCPKLNSLSIAVLPVLDSLSVKSSSIAQLEVQMLPMSTLSVDSPSLSLLNIEGCHKLQSVLLDCPALASILKTGSSMEHAAAEPIERVDAAA